jgi:glucosamine 6-phosphate synthetase-like amidotransferase/phosphosugar isomerase protein
MCGIIGYVGSSRHGEWSQTHGLLTELLAQSIERGRHATGFCARTERLDAMREGRIITDKQPLEATEFVMQNPFWRALERIRCHAVIAHVRYATQGDPAINANNHPHQGVVAGSSFSLIHNGWYTNVDEMVDRHSLVLQTDCDTEVAARLIERVGSIPAGLAACLKELRGAQALAVMEHRTGAVWLARDDNRPLFVCRLRDQRRYIFASTLPILARSVEWRLGKTSHWVGDIFPIAPGFVHKLTADPRIMVCSLKPTLAGRETELD